VDNTIGYWSAQKPQYIQYSVFEIVCVTYSSLLFAVTASGFAIYGILLIRKFTKMSTSRSQLLKRTLKMVAFTSSISIFCLLGRSAVLVAQMFVESMETKWYTIVCYHLLGEIVPLTLLIYILNLMTSHHGVVVDRLQKHHQTSRMVDPMFIHSPIPNTTANNNNNNNDWIIIDSKKPQRKMSQNRPVAISNNRIIESTRRYSSNTPAYPSLLRYSPQRHQISTTFNYGDNIGPYQIQHQQQQKQTQSLDSHSVAAMQRNDSQSTIQTYTDTSYYDESDADE
jgi:hypothetical protein